MSEGIICVANCCPRRASCYVYLKHTPSEFGEMRAAKYSGYHCDKFERPDIRKTLVFEEAETRAGLLLGNQEPNDTNWDLPNRENY